MNPYLKYTSLGFQLLFFLLAGYYLGKWVAEYIQIKESTGSAAGMLIFMGFGLYKLIRDVMADAEK